MQKYLKYDGFICCLQIRIDNLEPFVWWYSENDFDGGRDDVYQCGKS